jgi:hypothetical protein
MSDDHYREARPGHNAHGSAIPSQQDLACHATYLAGYSAAFSCALFTGHHGPHESFGGTSWS